MFGSQFLCTKIKDESTSTEYGIFCRDENVGKKQKKKKRKRYYEMRIVKFSSTGVSSHFVKYNQTVASRNVQNLNTIYIYIPNEHIFISIINKVFH